MQGMHGRSGLSCGQPSVHVPRCSAASSTSSSQTSRFCGRMQQASSGTFRALSALLLLWPLSSPSCALSTRQQANVPNRHYILCKEGYWNSLIAAPAFAISIFCVGALALFATLLYVMPRYYQVRFFRTSVRFLISSCVVAMDSGQMS